MRWGKNIGAAFQVTRALSLRTLVLALPVAASTALALSIVAVDRGVTATAREAAVSFGLDQVTVHGAARVIAGKFSSASTLTEEDMRALRSELRGVQGITATRRDNETPVSFRAKNGVYKVFGVTPEWAIIRDFGPERGQFVDQIDLNASAAVCVVGQTVARELFGAEEPIGQQILINQVPFTVKGVLVARGSSPAEGDRDARVIIPLTTFYDRLYRRLHLDQIVMKVSTQSPEQLAGVAGQVTAVMRRQHRIAAGQPDDFTVRTPMSITEDSRVISRSVFLLLFGLAAVAVLVASSIVALVFLQATRARQYEIGVRRAMGAEPGDILRQLWAEAAVVSILGGVLGVGLGVFATAIVSRWRELPSVFDATALAVPLIIVLLTSLAALLPARAAARLAPAEALRPVG
jgi:putative ABC transport system permease protein